MIDELAATRAALTKPKKPSVAAKVTASMLFVVLDVVWIAVLAWPFRWIWNSSVHVLWPVTFPSLTYTLAIMVFLLIYTIRLATRPTIVEV